MIFIRFFAILKPEFLTALEKADNVRELSKYNLEPKKHSKKLSFSSSGRKSEVELLNEERHDVMAWLQVSELGPSGEYQPVQVMSNGPLDPGSFYLCQGLQRRITLTMCHQSGRQLPWNRVTKIELGGIRLLDPKGRLHESSSNGSIELNVPKNQEPVFNVDGSSQLSVTCGWDSGRHDALYLNRVTSKGHRVLLRMKWYVDIENCEDNAIFSMDTSVNINDRNSRTPSKFLSFLTSTRMLQKTSSLFSIRLLPPPSRSAKALWRIDTNGRYIRGEENLGDWKARGVTLVEDHDSLYKRERLIADVQAMKSVMNAIGNSKTMKRTQPINNEEEQNLVNNVVDTWKQTVKGPKLVSINDPIGLESEVEPLTPLDTGFTTHVTLQPRSDSKDKAGYLFHLTNAHNDEWSRRYFVLKRPWLFIYTSSDELDELGVVNLTSAKLERSHEVENLLQVRFVVYKLGNLISNLHINRGVTFLPYIRNAILISYNQQT